MGSQGGWRGRWDVARRCQRCGQVPPARMPKLEERFSRHQHHRPQSSSSRKRETRARRHHHWQRSHQPQRRRCRQRSHVHGEKQKKKKEERRARQRPRLQSSTAKASLEAGRAAEAKAPQKTKRAARKSANGVERMWLCKRAGGRPRKLGVGATPQVGIAACAVVTAQVGGVDRRARSRNPWSVLGQGLRKAFGGSGPGPVPRCTGRWG